MRVIARLKLHDSGYTPTGARSEAITVEIRTLRPLQLQLQLRSCVVALLRASGDGGISRVLFSCRCHGLKAVVTFVTLHACSLLDLTWCSFSENSTANSGEAQRRTDLPSDRFGNVALPQLNQRGHEPLQPPVRRGGEGRWDRQPTGVAVQAGELLVILRTGGGPSQLLNNNSDHWVQQPPSTLESSAATPAVQAVSGRAVA